MLIPSRNFISEAVIRSDFGTNTTSAFNFGFDLPVDDHVKQLENWRKQCDDYKNITHGSFCERCDNPWHFPTGGAEWLLRTDWVSHPGRAGSVIGNGKDTKIESGEIPLVTAPTKDTIKELPEQELSPQEHQKMSDYLKDVLRMSSGGNISRRGKIEVNPDDLDYTTGDIAQESMARDKLLNEMRKQSQSSHSSNYVGLELMTESLEKGDVDAFLKNARKKIIKRSKATRKGCCMKIGGVLNQLLGPAGGEYGDEKSASDRGDADPIGEALTTEDSELDLVEFLSDEFSINEHDVDCSLRAAIWEALSEEEKFIQKAIKKPGALRAYFGVGEGESIPIGKARAKYNELRQKASGDSKLSTADGKLLKRLQLYLKVLKPAAVAKSEETDMSSNDSEVSEAAKALSKFMEASHTGAVGNLKPVLYHGEKKTRADQKDYPTEMKPVAKGANYGSGEPCSPKRSTGKPRYEKGAAPIGEDTISSTASALASFMEAAKHTGSAGEMKKQPYWGEKKERNDSREKLGGPENPVKGERSKGDWDPANKGESKPRYDKDADPVGGATKKQL